MEEEIHADFPAIQDSNVQPALPSSEATNGSEGRNWTLPTITVTLEPVGGTRTMPRSKTVLQLLRKLEIKPASALVIRDGGLLTPDRSIAPDDSLIVRIVTSSG